jgi:hypothetical protein
VSVTAQPRIEAYIGASGSGKGVSVARRLKELRPARLLVWDPCDEYRAQATAMRSLPAIAQHLRRAGQDGPFRVRYVPGAGVKLAEAFGVVCGLAFAAGNLVFVAEELSDVTSGGYAPPDWRQVITQGRHRLMHVLGCAQRPALIDKTFLGNATYIRCFTLRYDADRRAMAAALDVPVQRIAALETTEGAGRTVINYVERDFRAGLLRDSRIVLSR